MYMYMYMCISACLQLCFQLTILTASAIFAAGSVVMGVAGNKEVLLVGRFIVGAAVGE